MTSVTFQPPLFEESPEKGHTGHPRREHGNYRGAVWESRGDQVRFNPDPNAPKGSDPNTEVKMGVMGWVRPDVGSHPEGIRIAEKQKREEKLQTIAVAVKQIVTQWADKTVELAELLQEAFEQFPKTPDGRKQWKSWLRLNVQLGESRTRELLKIAKATDKNAAARTLRAETASRVAEHRARKKEEALRNAETVTTSEKICDWSQYCREGDAEAVWNVIEAISPTKPLHVAQLEFHLYVREKRPLKVEEIARTIHVDRGIAADLLQYGVAQDLVARTRVGGYVRAGEPRKPLDLYQCLVKNGLWFTLREVEEGLKRRSRTESEFRAIMIRKAGKLDRALEVAIENGYLLELSDGSVADDDINEMLVKHFHGRPTFKPSERYDRWVWEGFQAIRDIEQRFGAKAAAIFEYCIDMPCTLYKASVPEQDFEKLWSYLLKGVDIRYAIEHLKMTELSGLEWKSPSCYTRTRSTAESQLDLFLPNLSVVKRADCEWEGSAGEDGESPF